MFSLLACKHLFHHLKPNIMAKLQGPLRFTGKLEDLSAFYRKDLDQIIVRMKGGATKERIQKDPTFANTRRINSEFGGRSKMSKWIRKILRSQKGIFDAKVAGNL